MYGNSAEPSRLLIATLQAEIDSQTRVHFFGSPLIYAAPNDFFPSLWPKSGSKSIVLWSKPMLSKLSFSCDCGVSKFLLQKYFARPR